MKFSAVPYRGLCIVIHIVSWPLYRDTYRIVASVSWYVSYRDFAGDTHPDSSDCSIGPAIFALPKNHLVFHFILWLFIQSAFYWLNYIFLYNYIFDWLFKVIYIWLINLSVVMLMLFIQWFGCICSCLGPADWSLYHVPGRPPQRDL